MATNFEFYKNEIVKRLKYEAHSSTLCFGKIAGDILGCLKEIEEKCDCYDATCEECMAQLLELLAQEHIEQPKLTKRERAFCEAVQTGWIARDENGAVYFFRSIPKKGQTVWNISASLDMVRVDTLFGLEFEVVKWADENPWAVESLLQLEVQEDK